MADEGPNGMAQLSNTEDTHAALLLLVGSAAMSPIARGPHRQTYTGTRLRGMVIS